MFVLRKIVQKNNTWWRNTSTAWVVFCLFLFRVFKLPKFQCGDVVSRHIQFKKSYLNILSCFLTFESAAEFVIANNKNAYQFL